MAALDLGRVKTRWMSLMHRDLGELAASRCFGRLGFSRAIMPLSECQPVLCIKDLTSGRGRLCLIAPGVVAHRWYSSLAWDCKASTVQGHLGGDLGSRFIRKCTGLRRFRGPYPTDLSLPNHPPLGPQWARIFLENLW